MAYSGGDFEIDAKAFTELQRRLNGFDKKVARKLTKTVKDVAAPVVADVRRSALAIPSKGADLSEDKSWEQKRFLVGLRQGIAQATEFRMFYRKNGAVARIRVSGTKFAAATGKYRKLPRYVEGMGRKPWRHPVYATKGVTNGGWKGYWVEQKPTPFMVPVVLAQKSKVRQQIVDAFVNEVNSQLQAGNSQLFR